VLQRAVLVTDALLALEMFGGLHLLANEGPDMIDRTGTTARPYPGSSVKRTPATAEIGAPALAAIRAGSSPGMRAPVPGGEPGLAPAGNRSTSSSTTSLPNTTVPTNFMSRRWYGLTLAVRRRARPSGRWCKRPSG
jgi:hypothetical protein